MDIRKIVKKSSKKFAMPTFIDTFFCNYRMSCENNGVK